jgi:hypothetical protein
MQQAMASAFDDWLATQKVWPLQPLPNTVELVTGFYNHYLQSPFRQVGGGSQFNNLLWLYLLTKSLQPTLVVDSGTFRGASAWAFALAAENVPVVSCDIDLSRLVLRAPGVEYIQRDWITIDLSVYDNTRALCYFDDHVDQVRRLTESSDRGIKLLIFDDDDPITSCGAAMALEERAFPKIEFALDTSLSSVPQLEYISRGVAMSWKVPHDYLSQARSLISATTRLPNTSLITGIHQAPYRIVRLV